MSEDMKNSYKEQSESDRKRFDFEKKIIGGGKRKKKAMQ